MGGLPINRGKFIRLDEEGMDQSSDGCSMVKVRSSVSKLRKQR